MSNTKQQVHIDVFYGDRPTHESERRAISGIRAELQRRGISATLLVNFFLPRGARPRVGGLQSGLRSLLRIPAVRIQRRLDLPAWKHRSDGLSDGLAGVGGVGGVVGV